MTRRLPKISLITPTFNQAQFIKHTIQSVLTQQYSDLEYIVMDGGSTDGTIEILNNYNNVLKWFSEKDKGQSHALNKALKMVSGDIIGYVNSDDYLLPGSLNKVADFFVKNENAYWVTGKCRIIDENEREVRKIVTIYKNMFLKYSRNLNTNLIVQFISQPGTFWRRSVLEKTGYFDEKLYYDMDYDYWLRMWQKYKLYFIDSYLASYRIHKDSKAMMSPFKQFQIEYELAGKYTSNKLILMLHKIHQHLSLIGYKIIH